MEQSLISLYTTNDIISYKIDDVECFHELYRFLTSKKKEFKLFITNDEQLRAQDSLKMDLVQEAEEEGKK